MHKACIFGQVAVVRRLIDIGADVGAADGAGNTPLHYASRCGYCPLVAFLLKNGGDKDATNNDGFSPVDVASSPAAKKEFA